MCSETQRWNDWRRVRDLMIGIFLAPVAAATHAQANYALVAIACDRGVPIVLHIAPAIALIAGTTGLLIARRCLHSSETSRADEAAVPVHRSHFLAMFGILFSAAAILLVLMSWIPVFLLDPCL